MELPNTPGPKLGPFDGGRKPLNFTFISSLGSGLHSHVWKVLINGKTYALKMFIYFPDDGEAVMLHMYDDKDLKKCGVTRKLLAMQMAPFNCESRAYGRLKETGMEHVAVKCYGYLLLDEQTYGRALADIGFTSSDFYEKPLTGKSDNTGKKQLRLGAVDRSKFPFPIKALVKEYVSDVQSFEPHNIEWMAVHLDILHRVGIMHRDIRFEGNYLDSRILDFSAAWTVPHSCLDRGLGFYDSLSIAFEDSRDYEDFDREIDNWNKKHSNRQTQIGMRSGDHDGQSSRLIKDGNSWWLKRISVSGYDWKAADRRFMDMS